MISDDIVQMLSDHVEMWLANVCCRIAKHLCLVERICLCYTPTQGLQTFDIGLNMLSISFRRLALVVLLSAAANCLSTELSPKPIIIDPDIFSDVYDIGAIAVANTLHNCGKVDLRAVVINTPSEYGALAASVRTLNDDPRSCNKKFVQKYPSMSTSWQLLQTQIQVSFYTL